MLIIGNFQKSKNKLIWLKTFSHFIVFYYISIYYDDFICLFSYDIQNICLITYGQKKPEKQHYYTDLLPLTKKHDI